MARIRVKAGSVTVTVALNDSRTAALILEALPFESKAQTWGDEVYFDTPVAAGEEDPQAAVPFGAAAYWPPGKALCLFFGQTPCSPVNVVGAVEGDAAALKGVQGDDPVRVEKA